MTGEDRATPPGTPEEVHSAFSVEETQEVAALLARSLPGGSVVHLVGDLGVGKTHFAKGLAIGLGLDPDSVVSPTFTLVHPHPAPAGSLALVHVDLYRIDDPAGLRELGLDELPGSDGIAAVEWPERLGSHEVPGAVRVVLEDLGGTHRRITIARPGDGATPPGAIAR